MIPDTIGPLLPLGHSMAGIITRIREFVENPITNNIISVQSIGSAQGAPSNVILSSSTSFWQSSSTPGSFIQIDFMDRYVYPTHYSLRGYMSKHFATSWYLYGFNSGEENDQNKWFLLGDNSSSGTDYCEPLNGGTICMNDNVWTFSVRPTKNGFRYFRWITKECSHPDRYFLAMRGIELFGTYSIHHNYHNIFSRLFFPKYICKLYLFLFVTFIHTFSPIFPQGSKNY